MTYGKSKYGVVAVEAACFASEGVDPIAAWKASAARMFPDSPSCEHKGCPKSTFLGLAESGEIAGVKSGKYTKSMDNRTYAETALKLLRENESWAQSPRELWLRVIEGSNKKHNSQMDVVIALWRAKKFVGQNL
ncbi:MAG: hypothetical protein M0R41_01520 [Methylobacter tundripaludum]|uniref:Uncharacterized protein n=1 Tax=Methylobacter tundripaludum TaxID=173365 RepID=A0A2S6GTZ6_9GAMM|nr:hypothetical protein [Methylobacter tundripaludum]MCK9634944.1 hypothetical protein [Methylobacter tundripaludum]PPK68684.1 hypothetical protein B0F88_11192 [Methylobacter tundripaludum]